MEYKWNVLWSAQRLPSPFRLNPCFNGIQMEPEDTIIAGIRVNVLILVLMEYKWNAAIPEAQAGSEKS